MQGGRPDAPLHERANRIMRLRHDDARRAATDVFGVPDGLPDGRSGAPAAREPSSNRRGGLQWWHTLIRDRPAGSSLKPAKTLGWVAIGLSIVMLLGFATIRMISMAQTPAPTDAFEARYADHRSVALFHLIPGLLFLTLAPLQFMKRIRGRHLGFHRRLGRILAASAFVSGIFGLATAFRLPAFGGLTTQAATVFFGAIFLYSVTKAVRHIRRKQVQPHRERMIRTYALAMGVATIRVFLPLLMVFTGLGMEAVFGTAFWLGWGFNLLVAEVWINKTRVAPVRAASSLPA